MKKFSFFLLLLLMIPICVFADEVNVSLEEDIAIPESWMTLSEEEQINNLVNILTSVSTQKGITYISRTAGYKPRVLIEDAYVISDLDDFRSRTDDPVFEAPEKDFTLFVYQKDNRFGNNTYTAQYTVNEDSVELAIVNHTPLKIFGITCVKKEKMKMVMKVTIEDDSFHLFSSASADCIVREFLSFNAADSFSRRIEGMKNWFEGAI